MCAENSVGPTGANRGNIYVEGALGSWWLPLSGPITLPAAKRFAQFISISWVFVQYFSDEKSKHFWGGAYPDSCPVGRGHPFPTPHHSAPLAPRFSRLRRSTSAGASSLPPPVQKSWIRQCTTHSHGIYESVVRATTQV